MREPLDKNRLEKFFTHFASKLPAGGRIYITGGTSAILYGWRTSTIDADISTAEEPDNFFRAIAETKNELNINVELASPADFIPALPGWEMRSKYITTCSKTDFYHFDFYTQALSKIARGHERDHGDVESMFNAGLIDPDRLRDLFNEVTDQIERFPALSAETLKDKVTKWCQAHS